MVKTATRHRVTMCKPPFCTPHFSWDKQSVRALPGKSYNWMAQYILQLFCLSSCTWWTVLLIFIVVHNTIPVCILFFACEPHRNTGSSMRAQWALAILELDLPVPLHIFKEFLLSLFLRPYSPDPLNMFVLQEALLLKSKNAVHVLSHRTT